MELRIENKGNIAVVYLDKVNVILGGNQTGKTQKLKQFESIFKGNSDYALINGIEVGNGLFNVININENRDLEAEVSIKSKSSFHTNVIKPFVTEEYESISKYASMFTEKIQELLNNKSQAEFNYNLSNNSVQLDTKKVEKLETIIFELFSETRHSKGSLEEFYFYQALLQIKEGMNNILLIDDVDRYLDDVTLKKYVDYLNSIENVTIIITSKNKYILDTLKISKYINQDFKTIDLSTIAKEEMYKNFYEMENSNISLDNYILQSENFYSESDYNRYLNNNYLEILRKVEL